MALHVGLIGATGFGRHHLEGYQASPHVARVTLAGRNQERLQALAQEFPKVASVTTDHHDLLADPTVDLIDIVLPHDLHLPVALEAFQASKHVLVEKPPARTVAEFRQMIAAAEAAHRRLFVVMNLLFTPFHRTVRQIVDSGRLGSPFLALEVTTSNALKAYEDPDNWRADRERCGGGLQVDGGFHGVYRQLYFLESLGAPRWLTADSAQIGIDAPTKGEDFSTLTLAYETGPRIHLMNQWTARSPLGRFPSGILGTEGTLLFTGNPETPLLLRRPAHNDEPIPVPPGPQNFAESVAACVRHYAGCLALDQPPAVGLDLPMLTLEIITAAYQAATEGRRRELTTSFRTRFDDWSEGLNA